MSAVADLRMAARFGLGLRRFRRERVDAAIGRDRIAAALRTRASTFVTLVQRAVFGRFASPYRPLFERARIGPPQLATLVERHGIEGALAHLYDAGVHVRLDDFKGSAARSFDNPFAAAHYETRSGGTRSLGSRLLVDLDLLAHEACSEALFLEAFALADRPTALWRPAPPGFAGLTNALRHIKVGRRLDRWFSQSPLSIRQSGVRSVCFTHLAVFGSRGSLPIPEHVPVTDPMPIVRWLGASKARGAPAVLNTTCACGVRICLAALDHRVDIAGTFFRLGGEPYSAAKAETIRLAGCSAAVQYSMSEVGRIGLPCPRAAAVDAVHLMGDKVGVIQRPVVMGGGRVADALFLTTLLAASPKIMINVETGDYGVLDAGGCGCAFDRAGLPMRLYTIRSYEKLTSEGMHFIGNDLIDLVERTLPARFGGHPTDYQFVEEEEHGLPRVNLIVSPRVGALDDAVVVASVVDALGSRTASGRMMAGIWRDGGTLRVVRREPHVTSAAKILPLHVIPRGHASNDQHRP
jgi:hypothetical protein